LLCSALLAACANGEDERDVGATGTAVRDGRCKTPGPAKCFCSDGTGSGTQTCNADGTLTPCACEAAHSGGPSQPAAVPVDDALCEDLRDASGCVAQSYQSAELPSSVLFVLDRSGSMACNPPPLQDSAACETRAAPVDGTQPSKWQVTVQALGRVFDDLVAAGSSASVGLTFFSNDNTCGVQSTPSVPVKPITPTQVQALENALAATTPNGGTPLVGATTLAYAYLHQEASAAPGCQEPCGAPGNRYVVLITDGTDSCPNPARAEDAALCNAAGSCTNYLVQTAAPQAASANIRTFVIGAPGSEPARGYLSELAFVGGTARNGGQCRHDATSTEGDCHFDMTESDDFAAALSAALGNISSAALGCEFAVPSVDFRIDESQVNVQYQPSQGGAPRCFKYDDRACADGSNGWQFATKADGTRDLTRVQICGSACDAVRADDAAKVDVILGCSTIHVD
jgi:hypothetical protein